MMPLGGIIAMLIFIYVVACAGNAAMLSEAFGLKLTTFPRRLLVLIPFITFPLVIIAFVIVVTLLCIGLFLGAIGWIFVGDKAFEEMEFIAEIPMDFVYNCCMKLKEKFQ